MTDSKEKREIWKKGESFLYGSFEKYLWRNEKTGASLFRLKTRTPMLFQEQYCRKEKIKNSSTRKEDDWYTINCDGSTIFIPEFKEKTPIFITGYFDSTHDSGFGWDFKLSSVREASDLESATIEYLASGIFPKIKYEDAVKIANVSGADIHSFVQQPGALILLSEKTGLDVEVLKEMVTIIQRTSLEKDVFNYLNRISVPYPNCVKAVKIYGANALDALRQSPYTAGKRIGLSFRQCDTIAMNESLSPTDPSRITAISSLASDLMASSGHVWCTEKGYISAYKRACSHGCYEDNVEPATSLMFMSGKWMTYSTISSTGHELTTFYDRKMFLAERRIVENIKRLCDIPDRDEVFDSADIALAERLCGMSYGSQQKQAFIDLLTHKGIRILLGGPGTGKTSTLKGMLICYERMHPGCKIKLCAPSGRAAQRMAESTGREATTIHRMLEYRPFGDSMTCKNADDPLDADMVVVDEASMISIEIMDLLLAALKTGTSLFLVGDINQLESVGAGAVLRDLMNAPPEMIPRAVLTEVFRQKGGSLIIDNAYAINNGEHDLKTDDNFHIEKFGTEEELLERCKELAANLYDPENPFSTQVLCPSRKGPAGVQNINEELQKLLNPEKRGIRYGRTKFLVNDKVIMSTNNYQREQWYYNGDIGIIKDTNTNEATVDMRGETFHISRSELGDMDLSYGMTIHKSQGSEFENVIIILPKAPKMLLTRNLFYTAVTRAKKRVFILTEGDAMDIAITTNRSLKRRTTILFNDNDPDAERHPKPGEIDENGNKIRH